MKKYVNVVEIPKNKPARRFRARLVFEFDTDLKRKPAPKEFFAGTKAEADRKRAEWLTTYEHTVGADRKLALLASASGRKTHENRSDVQEAWKRRRHELGDLVGCYEPVLEFRPDDPTCRVDAKTLCSDCGRPVCNNHGHGPEVDSQEGYSVSDDGMVLCRECRRGVRMQSDAVTVTVVSTCRCGAAVERTYTSPKDAMLDSLKNAGQYLCAKCGPGVHVESAA